MAHALFFLSLSEQIWYLSEAGILAAGGSTHDFVVTWSAGPTNEAFTAFTLQDTDQTTPVSAVNARGMASSGIRAISPGDVAVGVNDIMVYATVANNVSAHTAAVGYTELSAQVIGATTSHATAAKQITVAGIENPLARWEGDHGRLVIVGVGFNGLSLAPLPIELISFKATARQTEVMLKWSTASEINNDFFTIQRSLNGEVWEDVIDVKGAGNSQTRIDYETTDGLPYSGVSYYRLKQTDFDKKHSYSQVRHVEITAAFQLKVYPNPSSGTFHVSTGFDLHPEEVILMNMVGQTIPLKVEAYSNAVLVESKSLLPGMYNLCVSRGYWKQSVRVVIE